MYLVCWDTIILGLFLADKPLSLQRSHTSRPGRRDCLSVLLILDISRREYALDAGLRGTRDSLDVSIFVELKLGLDKGRGGFVANGVEKTIDREITGFFGLYVLDLEALEEVAVTLAFGRDGLGSALVVWSPAEEGKGREKVKDGKRWKKIRVNVGVNSRSKEQ